MCVCIGEREGERERERERDHLLLMVVFYHHINTPIGFLCKWEINSKTFFDDYKFY